MVCSAWVSFLSLHSSHAEKYLLLVKQATLSTSCAHSFRLSSKFPYTCFACSSVICNSSCSNARISASDFPNLLPSFMISTSFPSCKPSSKPAFLPSSNPAFLPSSSPAFLPSASPCFRIRSSLSKLFIYARPTSPSRLTAVTIRCNFFKFSDGAFSMDECSM